MDIYSRHIADYICEGVNADDYQHPLKGMHIIVDAGNGNGGFFEKILSMLGAEQRAASSSILTDASLTIFLTLKIVRRWLLSARLWKKAMPTSV